LITCLIIMLGVLLILGIPIYIALFFSSLISLFFFSDYNLGIAAQRIFGGIDKFAIMAMPFYIFAASIMLKGGMSKRILDFASSLIGNIRGKVALTTQLACMFFGSLCGSSPATVAAIGSFMYPELKENNYGEKFATGLIASSGSVSLLIPPSITFIVYGATTGVSIGSLFIAGLGAGIVYGGLVLAYSYYYACKVGTSDNEGAKANLKNIVDQTKKSIWALGVPVIILGGIFTGFFTPTEAAAVSTVYALLVVTFIYKEMNLKLLYDVCLDSSATIAQLMMLLGTAALFGWVMSISFVPQMLTAHIVSIIDSQYAFLLIINIVFLIAGMFIDTGAAVMIFTPIIFQPAMQMGIDPVHLGVVIVANMCIGMFSPPFGLNLFVASSFVDMPIIEIYKAIVPFILLALATLLILTYVPSISLFLPNLMGY